MPEPQSEILIYQPEGGKTRIDVRLEDALWLDVDDGRARGIAVAPRLDSSIHWDMPPL